MDKLVGSLFGGQQGQQQLQDFAKRYSQGAPWDGISADEAVRHHDQVAANVPADVYQQSARESFDRLEPQQREQLGQALVQRAPQYGVQVPQVQGGQLQDSGFLANIVGQLQRQQPGVLGQILGGALGGGAGGGLASALGGGQQSTTQPDGGILSSPIAKAALGGIAALAAQKMLSGNR